MAPDDSTLITVVPDGATIDVGQQLQYTVELTKKGVTTNADPNLFNWVSSGPSVATVDNHGLALGNKAGNVTIKAQSKSQASNAGGASLTVATAPPIATVAATPEALLVRFASGREVSYVADGGRHLLHSTLTFGNGEVSQTEAFVPGIEGNAWLAMDPSGRALYVLSPGSHQVLALPLDLSTGLVDAAKADRYAVDSDVFAIAVGSEVNVLILHHRNGNDSRVDLLAGKQ